MPALQSSPIVPSQPSCPTQTGTLKTFSSQTIASTFDVFMVLALPHCLIIMFYNIFSPSSQAPFQVPQLWNSWLHHPKASAFSGIQWKESQGIYFDWGGAVPRACLHTLSRAPRSACGRAGGAQLYRIIPFLSRNPIQGSPAGHLCLGIPGEVLGTLLGLL